MKLEKFVSKNREGFDQLEPDEKVWERIESELSIKKTTKVFHFPKAWRIAASVMITLGLSVLIYTQFIINKNESSSLEAIAPAWSTIEVQYASLIEIKRNQLKSIEKMNPELYKEFWKETLQLEFAYNELKKQAISSPNPETVLTEMVNNLQLQINLLNKQLAIIKQIKLQ